MPNARIRATRNGKLSVAIDKAFYAPCLHGRNNHVADSDEEFVGKTAISVILPAGNKVQIVTWPREVIEFIISNPVLAGVPSSLFAICRGISPPIG